jgi:tryptophan halogenase
MPGEPISSVLVIGGGIVAWSAAAALRHRLPRLAVAVLAPPISPSSVSDRVTATLPSILEFHRDIGLSEGDAVLRGGSAFRLGIAFEGWSEHRPPFVHAYGEYGRPFGTASFHHHWVRLAREGRAAPFDSHSGAAAMARAGRFAPPPESGDSPLGRYDYGLQLDLPRYRDMLRAYALHIGVVAREGRVAEVRLRREDGFVDSIRVEDGSEAKADLFVDCTGPEARVRSALDQRFEDWSRWLPCDRLLLAKGPAMAAPGPLDRAVALAAGWRWRSEAPFGTFHGVAYASCALSDDEAAQMLPAADGAEPTAAFAIRRGRRSRPWLRNCVAVGESAVAVDPLEWTGLHLAHSAIDRIVAMMPDRDFGEVELWDYNRQCAAEADRVRDFLALHYLAASRPEPFWREAAAVEPPASLAHSLSMFLERGRLPYYEEETFAKDSWLAILIGLGQIPRRSDPLIDSVPASAAEQAMQRMREAIEAAIPNLPTQAAVLRNLTRTATP